MNPTALSLPQRASKPRDRGLTMVVDGGLPLGALRDLVASAGEYIDFVKFGWGTALVTNELGDKIALLRANGIAHYFGGTLFEKHLLQGRFDEFRFFCARWGCSYVEVSNGTIDLGEEEKAGYVAALSEDFSVISEVGFKDAARSDQLRPAAWIESIRRDLAAGAQLVTLEARESGRAGICHSDGTLRLELVEAFLDGLQVDRLLFEAPTTPLQAYLIGRVGYDVNLGNIPATGVLSLETLRLGLRSDTLSDFEERVPVGAGALGARQAS